jgi:hypothetical protein
VGPHTARPTRLLTPPSPHLLELLAVVHACTYVHIFYDNKYMYAYICIYTYTYTHTAVVHVFKTLLPYPLGKPFELHTVQ